MAAVAVGMASCSGILLLPARRGPLLATSFVVVGTASGSALVGDRCAAGSQSPCGVGMRCACCWRAVGSQSPCGAGMLYYLLLKQGLRVDFM